MLDTAQSTAAAPSAPPPPNRSVTDSLLSALPLGLSTVWGWLSGADLLPPAAAHQLASGQSAAAIACTGLRRLAHSSCVCVRCRDSRGRPGRRLRWRQCGGCRCLVGCTGTSRPDAPARWPECIQQLQGDQGRAEPSRTATWLVDGGRGGKNDSTSCGRCSGGSGSGTAPQCNGTAQPAAGCPGGANGGGGSNRRRSRHRDGGRGGGWGDERGVQRPDPA
jgi:hypothetical protein